MEWYTEFYQTVGTRKGTVTAHNEYQLAFAIAELIHQKLPYRIILQDGTYEIVIGSR
ncbi:MAG: hypothetical protein FWF59_00390 [Turicibacter sp.]|nr:hypothetical protein [Turicibacter sp.]